MHHDIVDLENLVTPPRVTVVGAGLAGCEASWQLAAAGVPVTLIEMRPGRRSPAHSTDEFAELVCSNSFKGTDATTATGSLKNELQHLDSFILHCARQTQVPAGAALAVDRRAFSRLVTDRVSGHPLVTVEHADATAIPTGPAIIATGPLTSTGMETALSELIGDDRLAFYDAAAPIVDGASIDRKAVFAASRYEKGGGADYLNCPLGRDEYEQLIDALRTAKKVRAHAFESKDLFQACQPVEEVARSGIDALRFGAMKPVGLIDPRTGERPWAVVQLRPENAAGTAYNLVGFQTNLTFPEQRRILGLIPGLEQADVLRFGVMHRNTFIDAPRILDPTLQVSNRPSLRLAGQLTGTEGYLEAAASGLLAGLNTVAEIRGVPAIVLPNTTALGALIAYATDPATTRYQPMHVNWGLVPPLDPPVRGKRRRYEAYRERAAADMTGYVSRHSLLSAMRESDGARE